MAVACLPSTLRICCFAPGSMVLFIYLLVHLYALFALLFCVCCALLRLLLCVGYNSFFLWVVTTIYNYYYLILYIYIYTTILHALWMQKVRAFNSQHSGSGAVRGQRQESHGENRDANGVCWSWELFLAATTLTPALPGFVTLCFQMKLMMIVVGQEVRVAKFWKSKSCWITYDVSKVPELCLQVRLLCLRNEGL